MQRVPARSRLGLDEVGGTGVARLRAQSASRLDAFETLRGDEGHIGDQLTTWRGDFGRAYTDRNVVDWETRVDTFRTILGDAEIGSVLEIGCNRGHNLVALSHILRAGSTFAGIEPQPRGREVAHETMPELDVRDGSIYEVPFDNRAFDLVLTSGVLIHVPFAKLEKALREVHRVSRRFILSIEYFAEEETTIPYRGHDDLLWKRDFLSHYQALFPDLTLAGSGDLTLAEGFDDARWWLLERPLEHDTQLA